MALGLLCFCRYGKNNKQEAKRNWALAMASLSGVNFFALPTSTATSPGFSMQQVLRLAFKFITGTGSDTPISYSQDRHIFHILKADGLTFLCMASDSFERNYECQVGKVAIIMKFFESSAFLHGNFIMDVVESEDNEVLTSVDAAASRSPAWIVPTLLAFPVVAYVLFNVY